MDDPDCDSTWEEDEAAEDGAEASAVDAGDAGDAGDASNADEGADEDVDEDEGPRAAWPGSLQSRMTGTRNWRAMQDMCRYRHHYPDLVERDSNGDMPNLSFYRNEIRFLPNGCFVEDILQNWKDNYELLEDNHSYIQWLFPLREPGVNWHAKPLTLKEVEAFKSSKEVRERLIRAYELMLGFYGIQLEDRDTGAVCRAQNYYKRFQNLNWRSHNNLRITRILKSLGELGLEHYQAPLARFFLEETLVRHELPGVRQSALDYFLFAVRCRRRRRELVHFAWLHFQPRCKFVWGPRDKLLKFKPQVTVQALASPRQVERDKALEDAPLEASTQAQTCGPEKDQDGDSASAEGPQPLGEKLQDTGNQEGYQQDQADPPSPKESKKRKLEANRREQAPGEPGPQGVSEVEKIALNLEGCALSQGSRDPGEVGQPCPEPPEASAADEVRKRRRVEEDAGGKEVVTRGGAQMPGPAPAEHPEVQKWDGGEGDLENQAGPEHGAPRRPSDRPGPAAAGTSRGETEVARMEPSVEPGKP
ncbi:opioid growth factor receptor isoform X2 [Heterocephalus glaber]|uniref:Opioid growth factor receptor isoform X2 n=1 Tax=Heterocephalus glaber TaxID=10181 RepID=A0AAX6P0C7_HETGA|nr:opioid growth factor receptor isoform X2 [Heterocephalus glaber]